MGVRPLSRALWHFKLLFKTPLQHDFEKVKAEAHGKPGFRTLLVFHIPVVGL